MHFQKTMVAGLVLALGPLTSFAQSGAQSNPADATASVPAVRYDSAFSSYTAFQEQQPGKWREHNDEMAGLGGHAGHIKGSAKGSEPGSEQPAPAESSMPQGMTDHGAHQKK